MKANLIFAGLHLITNVNGSSNALHHCFLTFFLPRLPEVTVLCFNLPLLQIICKHIY